MLITTSPAIANSLYVPPGMHHRGAEDVDEQHGEQHRLHRRVGQLRRLAPHVHEVAARERGDVSPPRTQSAVRGRRGMRLHGCGHVRPPGVRRRVSVGHGLFGGLFRGVPGEDEEHVVERRVVDLDVVDRDAGVVERADRPRWRGRAAARPGARSRARRRAPARHPTRAARARRRQPLVGLFERDLEVLAADARLELARGALGDDEPVVDHRDGVGQRVGLVEVLRGEQHGGAVGDERADDVPHAQPAGGVEPGGRLVEEQHRRARHQAGGEVEAAAHAAGVGLHHAVGGER